MYLTTDWKQRCYRRIKRALDKTLSGAFIERELNRLPCSALEYHSKHLFPLGWSHELKTLFVGTRDKGSSLYAFNGCEGSVLSYVYDFLTSKYAPHVKLTIPAGCIGRFYNGSAGVFNEGRSIHYHERDELLVQSEAPHEYVSFASCGKIAFPVPQDRNVNMMPFILGDKESLPNNLLCYHDVIEACPYLVKERGKVGYLTVHESLVRANDSQRRQGLHIETPGIILDQDSTTAFAAGEEHHWGGGHFYERDVFVGGIYFASSVDDTSVVYDALVDKSIPGLVDNHGGCEHLRGLVGPGTKLWAGELVWMTDRTPHEALAQPTTGVRQFFRLVTSNVSHWFADHSTPNPFVDLPADVVVVHGNKFT